MSATQAEWAGRLFIHGFFSVGFPAALFVSNSLRHRAASSGLLVAS
jgi:hypothetical protein